MALLPWPLRGWEVVIRPALALWLCLPTGWPHLMLSLIVTWPVSVSVVPLGVSRLLASGPELCAQLCPPQAQRWRNENFERPVDLEGSGDDDSFPDDELDDLYSGSGSGCKYLPLLFPVGGQCYLPPGPPHEALIAGNRGPCRLASTWGWGGQAGDHKHQKGRPSSWGWNRGLETSELRTPRSPWFYLYKLCWSPLQTSHTCQGTQTPLSNPGGSTATTSCVNLVATPQWQWQDQQDHLAHSTWVRWWPPVRSAAARGRFGEPWKGADASTVPGTGLVPWPGSQERPTEWREEREAPQV